MNSLIQVFIIVMTIDSLLPMVMKSEGKIDSEISSSTLLPDDARNDGSPVKNMKSQVCESAACRYIANQIKRGMNTSVEPCDDFYGFVCGAWGKANPIPKYRAAWSQEDKFQEMVNSRIKRILEAQIKNSDILPVRQAKKWYQSCMHIKALGKRGIEPMESILLHAGGWPMALDPEEWDEKEHSWQSVEQHYFHITGSYIFYHIKKSDDDESDVLLERGFPPLREQFPPESRNYTGNDYMGYVEYISDITRTFVEYNKAAVTDEMIAKDAEDLVEFEKQLYMLAETDTGDDSYIWTIGDFIDWYDGNITDLDPVDEIFKIDFRKLMQSQFHLVNRQINDSTLVTIDYMMYYPQLTELMNRTSTRTIVNYLHWYFVSDMLIHTSESMRNTFFDSAHDGIVVEERSPRWLECIEEMRMTAATAYAFVKKYFTPKVEKAAQEMVEIIRRGVRLQIDKSNWMDENSKTIAKEKLDAMGVIVGFPDWYRNKTFVLNFYRGLTIGYNHFDNVMSFQKYQSKKELLRYSNPLPHIDISMKDEGPVVWNAFYHPTTNHIALPAAYFQYPLFSSGVPPSVNYGMIGHYVGHEMCHGFDDEEILIGKDANRTNLPDTMLNSYKERADCFLEQFNQYYSVNEFPEVTESPRAQKTQTENIADAMGLNAVFDAFINFVDKYSLDEYKLAGFENFSSDQMFFISYAASYCEAVTPEYEEGTQNDVHSQGRLRVLGPISNSDNFARAFNCPVESPMNPTTKCDIWK